MSSWPKILAKIYSFFAKLFGLQENPHLIPKSIILEQMNEPRPLPMGRQEFMVWSDRIMAGALIPRDSKQSDEVYEHSVRYALANMLIHLGPTESHKPDAFFIHSLRKFAINQVADTLRKELFEIAKMRTAKEEQDNNHGANGEIIDFPSKESS